MHIDVTHRIKHHLRTFVVVILLTATTGIATARAQGVDSETLQSIVFSYNSVAEVLARANFRGEDLNYGQFAEAIQIICAEGNRRAVNVVARQIDTYARHRTLELRESILQSLQDDSSFEAFLADEDMVMREAGFSLPARQLAIRSMRRHREIAARSPDFRLTGRDTQMVTERINQICEESDNHTLVVNVFIFDEETPTERKSGLVWSVSKLVGGLALVGVNSLSWVTLPPFAAVSTSLGGIIAGTGATEIGVWSENRR